MKKQSTAILLVVLMLLAGCIQRPPSTSTPAPGTVPPATSAPSLIPSSPANPQSLEPVPSPPADPVPTAPTSPDPMPGVTLQERNNFSKAQLETKRSQELVDNRMGGYWHGLWQPFDYYKILDEEVLALGLKRVRLAINELDFGMVDWSKPELSIKRSHDDWITEIANRGITITYVLSFWDKEYRAQGKEVSYPRFKTEEQVQRYLDYVRFIVRHFKTRVRYFELWNEPNVKGSSQWIEADDYINLVRRTVPVIRQEYPEAKIVIGSVTPLFEMQPYFDRNSRDYLFTILQSDVMPLVDAVAWHVGGPSPEPKWEFFREYYYSYPSLLQEIIRLATAHGFKGEFIADEHNWRSFSTPHPSEPGIYTEIVSAKYYARGIIEHLGMDVTVGLAGISIGRPQLYSALQNISTIMAGAKPISLSAKIESAATNVKQYGFSLPRGDKLLALWTNGVAVDDDAGTRATVTIPGVSAKGVTGIDVLHGFEQELEASIEDGNLVIHDLLVKDYPVILQFTQTGRQVP